MMKSKLYDCGAFQQMLKNTQRLINRTEPIKVVKKICLLGPAKVSQMVGYLSLSTVVVSGRGRGIPPRFYGIQSSLEIPIKTLQK